MSIGYFNGAWRPAAEITIGLDDLGFIQGVTAVERLRTYQGCLFETDAHLVRFERTLLAIGIDSADNELRSPALKRTLDHLLERNADWIQAAGEVGVTIFATPGRGLVANDGGPSKPTLGIVCTPLDQPNIQRRQRDGQALVVTGVQQTPAESWPRDIKVRSRLHYYMADQEARRQSPGAQGVLIDQDGGLTETSQANLAIVREGKIVSPPAERVLPGVTEQVVRRYARRLGIEWTEQNLPPRCLESVDEILLMGTTYGVWNGWLFDRQPATSHPGPVCAQLQNAFPDSRPPSGHTSIQSSL